MSSGTAATAIQKRVTRSRAGLSSTADNQGTEKSGETVGGTEKSGETVGSTGHAVQSIKGRATRASTRTSGTTEQKSAPSKKAAAASRLKGVQATVQTSNTSGVSTGKAKSGNAATRGAPPRASLQVTQEDQMDVDKAPGPSGTSRSKSGGRGETSARKRALSSTIAAETPQATPAKKAKATSSSSAAAGTALRTVGLIPQARKFRAPKIDVLAPDSPKRDSEKPARQLPPKLLRKSDEDLEEMFNEDGEDESSSNVLLDGDEHFSDEEAAEMRDDVEADIDLAAEAVIVQSIAPASASIHSEVARAMSVSSLSSLDPSGPPTTTDEEDHSPSDEEPSDGASSSGKAAVQSANTVSSGKRALKLRQEVPTVQHGRRLHKRQGETLEAKPTDDMWMARTDISSGLTASGRSFTVNLATMQEPMASVVRLAINLAMIHIVFGIPDIPNKKAPPYTLFDHTGLAQFSIDALIAAAEEKGFQGQYDVAHRLEAGSEVEYILPLCNYVTARSRTYRGKIKEAASNIVPIILKYDADTPVEELQVYITTDNFMYPRLPSGKFDYTQPFGSSTISAVIKAAFFTAKQYHRTGILFADRCTSSSPSAKEEREVPLTMLALAATAIECVLIDRVQGAVSDFGITMQGPYKEHLITALDLLVKRQVHYHNLTHKIYSVCATGHIAGVQDIATSSTKRGTARVDWDNIPE